MKLASWVGIASRLGWTDLSQDQVSSYERLMRARRLRPRRAFQTELARMGAGSARHSSPEDAARDIHDIFLASAKEMLDVRMLCGSLRKKMRDDFYTEVNGVSFSKSVREVLAAGSQVQILIWNGLADWIVSPKMQDLIREAKSPSPELPGLLDVRASGSKEHMHEIGHFLLAKRGKRWLLRAEQPDTVQISGAGITHNNPQLPATIDYDKQPSTKESDFATIFNKLFAAAGRSDRDNEADYSHWVHNERLLDKCIETIRQSGGSLDIRENTPHGERKISLIVESPSRTV